MVATTSSQLERDNVMKQLQGLSATLSPSDLQALLRSAFDLERQVHGHQRCVICRISVPVIVSRLRVYYSSAVQTGREVLSLLGKWYAYAYHNRGCRHIHWQPHAAAI